MTYQTGSPCRSAPRRSGAAPFRNKHQRCSRLWYPRDWVLRAGRLGSVSTLPYKIASERHALRPVGLHLAVQDCLRTGRFAAARRLHSGTNYGRQALVHFMTSWEVYDVMEPAVIIPSRACCGCLRDRREVTGNRVGFLKRERGRLAMTFWNTRQRNIQQTKSSRCVLFVTRPQQRTFEGQLRLMHLVCDTSKTVNF